jgi:hypothetical membrane protein
VSGSRTPPWWAVLSSAGAFVALVGGWLTAEALQPPGYNPVRMTISALARHGADHRWVMTVGLYAIGACHLVTAAGLRGLRTTSRAVLALAGVAGLGLAACAQPDHGSTNAHLVFAVLGFATLAIWPLTVASRSAVRFPSRPRDAVLSAVLSALLLGWLVQAIGGTTLGLAERALTAQQELWPLLVVLGLRSSARSRGDAGAGDQLDAREHDTAARMIR